MASPNPFSGPDLSAQTAVLVDAAKTVAKAVQSRGGRALLVGGFVRDLLLGTASQDADMEVFGMSGDALESLLAKLFPGRVNTVGRSFSTFKIALGEGRDLDVSLPRRESKTGKGHKGFAVEGDPKLTMEEAARRRDFTINAMLLDPVSGELIDPFGGQKDLAERRLRVVDPDTFGDDPLRVWRGIQFTARFALDIDPATFEIMRDMVTAGEFEELSKERITAELKKLLLLAERPSDGFELARRLGIIHAYYPAMDVLEQTPQEHEWHPEGDVWIHTMMVIDAAARLIRQPKRLLGEEDKLHVMLGALCHDLGKPSTTAMGEKNGVPRIRSLGHEEAGVAPAKELLSHWSFGQDAETIVCAIVRDHLKPGMLFIQRDKGELDDEQYDNAVRKLVRRIHPAKPHVFVTATEADFRGRGFPDVWEKPYEGGRLFMEAVKRQELEAGPAKPLLSGEDLIALGAEPGPRMGELLRKIEGARDAGEIKTKEEAVALARRLLAV